MKRLFFVLLFILLLSHPRLLSLQAAGPPDFKPPPEQIIKWRTMSDLELYQALLEQYKTRLAERSYSYYNPVTEENIDALDRILKEERGKLGNSLANRAFVEQFGAEPKSTVPPRRSAPPPEKDIIKSPSQPQEKKPPRLFRPEGEPPILKFEKQSPKFQPPVISPQEAKEVLKKTPGAVIEEVKTGGKVTKVLKIGGKVVAVIWLGLTTYDVGKDVYNAPPEEKLKTVVEAPLYHGFVKPLGEIVKGFFDLSHRYRQDQAAKRDYQSRKTTFVRDCVSRFYFQQYRQKGMTEEDYRKMVLDRELKEELERECRLQFLQSQNEK